MFGIKEGLHSLIVLIRLVSSLGLSIESVEVDGFEEKIYTVMADMSVVRMEQRLSFDTMFGFEPLSRMTGPMEIGVNGMFYNDVGEPAGMMIKDGNIIKQQSAQTPLFILRKDGKVELIDGGFETNIDVITIKEGFQTGGWLVKSGENVAADYEPFFGYTTSLQPRTAIGITETQKVAVMVVDGRQKGYSLGVTGKQLANLMLEKGCVEAAYLDGGASTELVYGGRVINQPSLGEEKPIPHGIFFLKRYDLFK